MNEAGVLDSVGTRHSGGRRNGGPGRWILDDRFFTVYDRVFGETHLIDVLREVAAVVSEVMDCERATIYLVDSDTMELKSVALTGNVPHIIRLPLLADSLAGYCALSQRAFMVPDAYADLSCVGPEIRFDRTWDQRSGFRTRDVMCAPVLFKGQLEGVVQVLNGHGAPFREDDLEAFTGIARMIGYSLHHARMYDDLASFRQVEREKGTFLRVMVHELKAPLAAAKTMADAMLLTCGGNEAVSRFASRIGRRLEHLLDMIGDLLALAKVKEGGTLGEVKAFDLRDTVQLVCAGYREQAAAKEVVLDVGVPGRPVPVRFDTTGCPMVVSNLISNAVKYTPKGTVTVSLRAENGEAVLDVMDSGIGIPAADIPKLFHEFYRATNARKAGIQGSGVGLTGVKCMVERFGGTMGISSVEGEGSTFTVRLPLCAADAVGSGMVGG